MDDVILCEGPPCFTEQVSIIIKTLVKDRENEEAQTQMNKKEQK